MLGKAATNCPVTTCEKYNCYEECEHSSKIMDSLVAKPYRRQAFLWDLIQAIWKVQEQFIKCLCEDEEVCEKGWALGFPCMQCGLADYSLTPAPMAFHDCGIRCLCEVTTSLNSSLNFDECEINCAELSPAWVDLSQGEYLATYTALVDALNCVNGCAGGQAINDVLGSIDGELLGINGNEYNILLPNDPAILSILTIISTLIPLPIGATPRFFVDC